MSNDHELEIQTAAITRAEQVETTTSRALQDIEKRLADLDQDGLILRALATVSTDGETAAWQQLASNRPDVNKLQHMKAELEERTFSASLTRKEAQAVVNAMDSASMVTRHLKTRLNSLQSDALNSKLSVDVVSSSFDDVFQEIQHIEEDAIKEDRIAVRAALLKRRANTTIAQEQAALRVLRTLTHAQDELKFRCLTWQTKVLELVQGKLEQKFTPAKVEMAGRAVESKMQDEGSAATLTRLENEMESLMEGGMQTVADVNHASQIANQTQQIKQQLAHVQTVSSDGELDDLQNRIYSIHVERRKLQSAGIALGHLKIDTVGVYSRHFPKRFRNPSADMPLEYVTSQSVCKPMAMQLDEMQAQVNIARDVLLDTQTASTMLLLRALRESLNQYVQTSVDALRRAECGEAKQSDEVTVTPFMRMPWYVGYIL